MTEEAIASAQTENERKGGDGIAGFASQQNDERVAELEAQLTSLRSSLQATETALQRQTVAAEEAKGRAGALAEALERAQQEREEEDRKSPKEDQQSASKFGPPPSELHDTINKLREDKTDLQERLRQSEDKCRQLERQREKLEKEVKDLDEEFKTVKNQEVQMREMKEKLRETETRSAESLTEKLAERDRAWENAMAQLRGEHQTELSRARRGADDLERQVAYLEVQLKEAANKAEQQRVGLEKLVEGKKGEVAALLSDVESLTSENRELKSNLREALARYDNEESKAEQQKFLRKSLEATQERVQGLETELAAALQSRDRAMEEWSERVNQLVEETGRTSALLQAAAAREAELSRQLEQRPSESEVASLRERVQNAVAVDSGDVSAAVTDLEKQLMGRQKQLQVELSRLRGVVSSLEDDKRALEKKEGEALEREKELNALVRRLEDQTAAALASGGGQRGFMGPEGSGPSSGHERAGGEGDGGVSPSPLGIPSLSSPMQAGQGPPMAAEGAGASDGQAGPPSVMQIVAAQRDRFRQRVLELEQTCDRLRESLAAEKETKIRLQRDNVSLVEQARYLESVYHQGGGGAQGRSELERDRGDAGGSERGGGGGRRGGEMEMGTVGGGGGGERDGMLRGEEDGGGDVEQGLQGVSDPFASSVKGRQQVALRYRQEYEQSVDPFARFREGERQRKLQQMDPASRVLVQLGQILLANGPGRAFLAFYLLSLHLLVFLSLWRATHCRHHLE
uniref:CASP C-terminal domain-containing protein n=1 Tax=Chromera velia CCMP2878 TaxID=1169474 RepID=A0A0G4FIR5_9ALVE|eukprot:Cvel_3377.t1-p1 / transcript=Cvel_3377.t1 / gene=Cvel_3377 / organism=Chromera_velia_CCMP2878 / gene_product=Putative WEB family protein At1g65010,, putative / transcript_product=Putative WEB family protein At1g65010,, putative / location=Cvel_scaffold136:120-8028(+) / protein_length=745 / sequence_SO=supercontig / SO=protein_coding / is_pseudo=false